MNFIRVKELVKSYLEPIDSLSLHDLVHPTTDHRAGDFFFIQIGANDGRYRDPIYKFVKKYRWRGILVEPVSTYCEALRCTYAHCDGLTFENVAISNTGGSKKLYRIDDRARWIARWYKGIASFDRDHLLKHRFAFPRLEDHIVEEDVQCVTLGHLIRKHGVQKIDLLVLEVEGHEFAIIKQIRSLGIRPLVVIFEHRHIHMDTLILCDTLLTEIGYKVNYTLDDGIASLI